MGIENNLDVQLARFDPLIATEDTIEAWGFYDPQLFGDYLYSHRETPVASMLQSGGLLLEKEHFGRGGLTGEVPKLGWNYEHRLRRRRARVDLVDPVALAAVHDGPHAHRHRCPCSRTSCWNEPWLAGEDLHEPRGPRCETFRLDLMDIVVAIETRYWDLIAAEERLRVANKSLEANLTLLDQTKAQYDVGVVSRVEVVEAEAGVAKRDFERIRAENFYRAAQDNLIDIVLGPNLTPDSTLEIEPTTIPDVVPVRHRPRGRDREGLREPSRARDRAGPTSSAPRSEPQVRARTSCCPQVDAVGSYGYNGLAGPHEPSAGHLRRPRRTPIRGIGRHYGDADDDFFEQRRGAHLDAPAAVLSIPLGNVSGARREAPRRLRAAPRRAPTLRREEQQAIARDPRRDPQPAVRPGGHRGRRAPSRWPPRSSSGPRASASSTASRPPSTSSSARRTWSTPRARRSRRSRSTGTPWRRSTGAQGTILRERNVIVEQARDAALSSAGLGRTGGTVSLFGKNRDDRDSTGKRPATPEPGPWGTDGAPRAGTAYRSTRPRVEKPTRASAGGEMANIGKSISIKGDLSGNEDLVVEGNVEGRIELPNNQLTIGANGNVKADISAKSVVVVGKVAGNVDRRGAHPDRGHRLGPGRRDARPGSWSRKARPLNGSVEMGPARRPWRQGRVTPPTERRAPGRGTARGARRRRRPGSGPAPGPRPVGPSPLAGCCERRRSRRCACGSTPRARAAWAPPCRWSSRRRRRRRYSHRERERPDHRATEQIEREAREEHRAVRQEVRESVWLMLRLTTSSSSRRVRIVRFSRMRS